MKTGKAEALALRDVVAIESRYFQLNLGQFRWMPLPSPPIMERT